jgi:diguanylate cyclase (GGDEF)-like protein
MRRMAVGAGVVGLASAFVPHGSAFHAIPVVVLSLLALGAGVAGLALRRPSRDGTVALGLGLATVGIAAANILSEATSAPFAAFYFWPVLGSARFLDPRHAASQLSLALMGLGASFFAAGDPDGVVRFVANGAALALAAWLVGHAAHREHDWADRLARTAVTDGLTGLGNRRAFDQELRQQLGQRARGGPAVSLVLLDIDRFKAINDSLGHARGDEVLRGTADAMRRTARVNDRLFRIGGDEFALIVHAQEPAGAVRLAERLRFALRAMDVPGGAVTASIGVAQEADDPGGNLFLRADRALYRAKAGGRDRVCAATRAGEVDTLADEHGFRLVTG